MRIAVVSLSVVFSLYAAIQSYIIADMGATYQVAQLEGDGGGGLVFAVLCLISGLLAFVRPLISFIAFLIAAALSVVVSITYSDNVMIFWGVAAVILSAAHLYLHMAGRKTREVNRAQVASK